MVCPECGKTLPQNAVKCNKCGKIFKEVQKNSETDEFLKKEKAKSEERAKKLSEKKLKTKDPEKTAKIKKTLKIVIPCLAAVILIAAVIITVIQVKSKKEQEYTEKNFPELLIEYTYPEVPDEKAVMKLGNINISAEEYEFFYRQSFSNIQNSAQLEFKQYMGEKLGDDYSDSENYYDEYYGEYSKDKHNIFDFSKPVNAQEKNALDENGNEISWQEYIRADAIKTMTGYRVKFELARKSGMQLTDDIRYQVYEHIEGLREAISGSGYQNLNQYLQILFGSGCDEEFFKNELIREYTASKYDVENSINKMNSYSDDEVKKIYETNRGEYDYIDLCVYEVTGKDAEKTAGKIADAATDADDFTAAIQKYENSSADKTSLPAVPKQYIDNQYSKGMGKWAYDSSRKAGDKAVFKTVNGFTAAVIQTPAYTTENSVSYREIVISKVDENGNILPEDKIAEAKASAEQIYADWQDGDADENTFAYYALTKSSGSTTSNGGLVTYAAASNLSENLKNWISAKERKNGDTQFIDTDSSYTIVYFLKNYGSYWNYAIRAQKSGEDTTADYEKQLADSYSQNFDSSSVEALEETIITEMNRIYFGIGA